MTDEILYRLETVGRTTIVHFEIDHLASQPLDGLYSLVTEGEKLRVVLDFSAVTMVTSIALVALVSFRRKLIEKGGQISVYGLEENLEELFRRSRLQNFFRTTPSRDDAIRMVNS